jgi:hypothetical protein
MHKVLFPLPPFWVTNVIAFIGAPFLKGHCTRPEAGARPVGIS